MTTKSRSVTVGTSTAPISTTGKGFDDGSSVFISNPSTNTTSIRVGGPETSATVGVILGPGDDGTWDLESGEVLYACALTTSTVVDVDESGL